MHTPPPPPTISTRPPPPPSITKQRPGMGPRPETGQLRPPLGQPRGWQAEGGTRHNAERAQKRVLLLGPSWSVPQTSRPWRGVTARFWFPAAFAGAPKTSLCLPLLQSTGPRGVRGDLQAELQAIFKKNFLAMKGPVTIWAPVKAMRVSVFFGGGWKWLKCTHLMATHQKHDLPRTHPPSPGHRGLEG